MGALKEYASTLTYRQRLAIGKGDHSTNPLSAEELALRARQLRQSMGPPCVLGRAPTSNIPQPLCEVLVIEQTLPPEESFDYEMAHSTTDEENEQYLQYQQYLEGEKQINEMRNMLPAHIKVFPCNDPLRYGYATVINADTEIALEIISISEAVKKNLIPALYGHDLFSAGFSDLVGFGPQFADIRNCFLNRVPKKRTLLESCFDYTSDVNYNKNLTIPISVLTGSETVKSWHMRLEQRKRKKKKKNIRHYKKNREVHPPKLTRKVLTEKYFNPLFHCRRNQIFRDKWGFYMEYPVRFQGDWNEYSFYGIQFSHGEIKKIANFYERNEVHITSVVLRGNYSWEVMQAAIIYLVCGIEYHRSFSKSDLSKIRECIRKF